MIIVNTVPPETCTMSTVFDYFVKNYQHFLPVISYHQEAGRKWHVNWLLLHCWGAVRSKGWTSEEYRQNQDIFALGGRYETYRSSVETGANELAKFESTEMMSEQDQLAVEKLYMQCIDYCNGIPPANKPPLPPVEEPIPPKPEPEPAPDNGKPWFNWKVVVPMIAAALSIGAYFLPGWTKPIIDLVKMILTALGG